MSKKIMIVDDSSFMYEEMKHMLKDSQFHVVGYSRDGEGALEEYKKSKPDVVTMDIILPGIDGLEAAKNILAFDPSAQIIIVSSLAYDDTTDQAKALGINHLIFKPFSKEELFGALGQM